MLIAAALLTATQAIKYSTQSWRGEPSLSQTGQDKPILAFNIRIPHLVHNHHYNVG